MWSTEKGDRLSKILRMECSRIFTGLGGPWNEFQKVCRDYFKYSGSFAHSLSRLCLGTEAGGVFLPFVIGWIVAAIANPVVRFFEKRLKIVRRHGSMVLIAGVLALVIFGIYALFSWVFRETTEFGQALPGIYASIREEVDLACERIGDFEVSSCRHGDDDRFRAGECGWIYR